MMAAEVGNECLLAAAAAVTMAAPGGDGDTVVFQPPLQEMSRFDPLTALDTESTSPASALDSLLSEPMEAVGAAAPLAGAGAAPAALPLPPDEVDSFDGHEFEEEEVEIPLMAPPTNQ